MYRCNLRIENTITKALLKLTEDEIISSVEELALEIDKDQEVKDLVHQGCIQMKKPIGIDTLSPGVSKHCRFQNRLLIRKNIWILILKNKKKCK